MGRKKQRLTWFIVIFLSILLAFIDVNKINGQENALTCPEEVTVHLFEEGWIKCQINVKFTKVYWYSTQSSAPADIYLIKEESNELGPDSALKEFGISDNGSLIIKNVTKEHEKIYRIIVVDNQQQHWEAKVIVRVSPSNEYPRIDECESNECHLCVESSQETYPLTCVMDGKPLTLKWYEVVSDTPMEIEALPSSNPSNPLESFSEVDIDMTTAQVKELMCVPSGVAATKLMNASVLLIKESVDYSTERVKEMYFKVNETLRLKDINYRKGVWIKQNNFRRFDFGRSRCDKLVTKAGGRVTILDGELQISNYSLKDEGLYTFVYKHRGTHERVLYDVTTKMPPDSTKSCFAGCKSPQKCNMIVKSKIGSITCAVNRTRPAVSITCKIVEDQSGVKFVAGNVITEQQNNEKIFNTYQILKYEISNVVSFNLSCTISGIRSNIPYNSLVTLNYDGTEG